MGWPTAVDLQKLLEDGGLSVALLDDLDAPIQDAIEQLQDLTGYSPFLSDSHSRVYDPPGLKRVVNLGTGATAITSVTASGVALVAGRDYWPEPANNPAKGRPYEWIRFASVIYGLPQSLTVTATFGRMDTISDRVFQMILKRAAVLKAPTLLSDTSDPTDRITVIQEGQDRIQMESALARSDKRVEEWQRVWTEGVEQYKRRAFC